jgi:hypothetical protein
MRIGALLSALALLTIFLYQMLLQHIQQYGGTYPSGLLIIVAFPLLAFGIIFLFSGAKVANSRIGFLVALACVTLLLVFILQFEYCLSYCARP